MRAGDVLREDTLKNSPLDEWVKICRSCTEIVEEAFGKEEEEEEAFGPGEEEEEDEEWVPALLPRQPNLPEDWDLYLSVQDHLPFAEEDQE